MAGAAHEELIVNLIGVIECGNHDNKSHPQTFANERADPKSFPVKRRARFRNRVDPYRTTLLKEMRRLHSSISVGTSQSTFSRFDNSWDGGTRVARKGALTTKTPALGSRRAGCSKINEACHGLAYRRERRRQCLGNDLA